MPSSNEYAGRILPLRDDAAFSQAVDRAARVISEGGLIVYPTETVYGIGADARNAHAIARIAAVKGRDERKPILVLVGSSDAVAEFASVVPEGARRLMEAFWPGPLTLVFAARREVSELLTGGSGSVGLRFSPDPFCRSLIQRSGTAVTSTSANRAGQPTPETIEEIGKELGAGIDLYLDGGPRVGRLPSTIVDVSGPLPVLVREGAIGRAELLAFVRGI